MGFEPSESGSKIHVLNYDASLPPRENLQRRAFLPKYKNKATGGESLMSCPFLPALKLDVISGGAEVVMEL